MDLTRREFLAASGITALTLSLGHLHGRLPVVSAQELLKEYEYRDWEDLYRQQWRWDRVVKGTHLVDCYPGSCSFDVYVKDGMVWREEQAGTYPPIEAGVPDMNPRGCQKGCCFSNVMYAPERLKYPLRRKGERGEGKWERISWDDALGEIADAVIKTIRETGPEAILHEPGPGNFGLVHGMGSTRLWRNMGATTLDIDGVISDFNVGLYITFGKFHIVSSIDDWFQADRILIWHMNPVYTRIPSYHYISEARYKGTEVISIAPDYNPSSIHADAHVKVDIGTDAALGLSMCKVMVDEKLYQADFITEQTDLPFLVRTDSKKFLRESDVREGGQDDQFYFLTADGGKVVEAPRATLKLDGHPVLEGTARVKLRDGQEVEVKPVFELLKEKLADYTPEKAGKICEVHPDVIRTLARKVASGRTHILVGWNTCKCYHGDLMERTMCLVLALTGNWGKKGSGIRGWNAGFDATEIMMGRRKPGPEGFNEARAMRWLLEAQLRRQDPTLTDEMLAIEVAHRMGPRVLGMVPPVFYWYHHAGYKEVWNRREWGDPTMKRSFDDYMREAVEKGWWEGMERPAPDKPPRVYIGVGGSTLRRTRGGQKQLLRHIWPKLDLIVTVDWRMSTTALYSDIILPAAAFYEKADFRFFTPHITFLTFTDQAVPPPEECKPEWEIFGLLAKKIQERAHAQGFLPYKDAFGQERRLDTAYDLFTMDGAYTELDGEKVAALMVDDAVRAGQFSQGTTLETFRKKGIVRITGTGINPAGLNLATDVKPDETVVALTWHVEGKVPYPTLTRRAQFYIDHDWFLEAGEELPVHKPTPTMGGNYPFRMTSGHQRWSIHSIWVANKLMQQTHRGGPFLSMNPEDAKKKGVADGDLVRVFNDFESFKVNVKLAPNVRPGQIIIYHAWEPYQFPERKSYDIAIPGMVKWLHLAGGYGHLKYWPMNWQPQQVDRAVCVEVEKG